MSNTPVLDEPLSSSSAPNTPLNVHAKSPTSSPRLPRNVLLSLLSTTLSQPFTMPADRLTMSVSAVENSTPVCVNGIA